jgi:hypothetical protein
VITPYFGRAFKITVTPQEGGEVWTVANSAWGEESLRCTFRIEQLPLASMWFADIVIYNISHDTQKLIRSGDLVTVTAGHLAPGSGLIFSGKVFQPLWDRPNETDFTLTLHCLVRLWDLEEPHISTVIPAGLSPAAQVQWVADTAGIPVYYLDPSLAKGPKNPRATSWAGPPTLFFLQMQRGTNLNFWYDFKGIVIRSLEPQSDTPDIIYAPPFASDVPTQTTEGLIKYTLIGTPQQLEDGVQFRVLLDPDMQLGKLAQIAAIYKKLALYPNQKLFIDPAGIYVVAGITHIGDTRGNEWYTEVHAITRALSKMNALQAR